jgi:hypothetical protein
VKALLLLVCIVVAVAPGKTLSTARSEQTHSQWIEERYREATSIKEGMTVADLQKVFTEDGGLQSSPSLRYILKSCMWIKIDVQFDIPEGDKGQYPPSPNVRIKKVSKPYLEQMIID